MNELKTDSVMRNEVRRAAKNVTSVQTGKEMERLEKILN